MDFIDKKIIFILQRQADLPLSEISKRVGLSQTPCWNRIKKLEEDGVIEKKVTLINKRKVNLPVTVFLMITVRNHNSDWMKKFNEILKSKGLTQMEVNKGDKFDAESHEAITQIKADKANNKGKIVDVIEKGYKLGDKILRYPKVVVAN